MKIVPVGLGVFPDIAPTAGGWVEAHRVPRGPLTLVWLSREGAVLDSHALDTGSPEDSTFARLMRIPDGSVRLAYRAVREGQWQVVLREVIGVTLGQELLFGRCAGNNPICLGETGWLAWQDEVAVRGVSLLTGEAKVLRPETRPTGIARLDGETVVFIDEARLSVDGMLNPVSSHGCTVGEHRTAGIAVTLGTKTGRFLPTQECMTPRVAADVNRFAAVTWGAMGVRVVLFEEADIVEPPLVIPRINRPLWLGWFEFAPATLPGNCRVRVNPAMLVETLDGKTIAHYVQAEAEGSTPAALEKAIADSRRTLPGVPVLVYWPRGAQSGPVPSADLIGLELYWKVGETLDAFETYARRAIARCPAAILIAQVYTSNTSNHTDLAALVPVYARLAQQSSNVLGILAFSGSGRATGYQDHPEVHALWAELAAGIPGPPLVTVVEDEMKAPKIEGTIYDPIIKAGAEWKLAFQDEGSGTSYAIRKDAQDKLWIEARNAKGTAKTGVTRILKVEGATVSPSPTPTPPTPPTPTPSARTTSFKTAHGTFLSVARDKRIVTSATEELFEVITVPGGVALRIGGLFVAAEDESLQWRLNASRTEVGAWETFVVERQRGGFSLRTAHGKYVAAEPGGLVFGNRDVAGAWETFEGTLLPTGATLVPLRADGKIFRAGDTPWRWKGVTAFQLLDRFARDEDVTPFFQAFVGFNLLRVFPYVPVADWKERAWNIPDPEAIEAFCATCAAAGFYVELTLLTDDDPGRVSWARRLIEFLVHIRPLNLLLEAGNEPKIHKNIDTQALKDVLASSGFLHTSGEYIDMTQHYGTYITSHTERDEEWPRRAHDLFDYSETDGGPHLPGPRLRMPAVADEPIRPDQAGYNERDYLTYFGTCSILGAGATFHYENGKYGRPPDANEARCAKAALQGLDMFPADAPLGPYRRPVENSLRTYVVGNYMVRVRPTTLSAPESGWRALDTAGILWTR
jgi:hypothetical protein